MNAAQGNVSPIRRSQVSTSASAEPTLPFKWSGSGGGNGGMEARIAKLESDVEYIKRDIGDLKTDVREVRTEVTGIRKELHSAKIWALILYAALAGSLFSVLARGFKWI